MLDVTRNLEVGEALGAPRDELGLVDLASLARHDDGERSPRRSPRRARRRSPPRRHPGTRRSRARPRASRRSHRGVARCPSCGRRSRRSRLVHADGVARVQPAVTQGLSGLLRIVEVSEHRDGIADQAARRPRRRGRRCRASSTIRTSFVMRRSGWSRGRPIEPDGRGASGASTMPKVVSLMPNPEIRSARSAPRSRRCCSRERRRAEGDSRLCSRSAATDRR